MGFLMGHDFHMEGMTMWGKTMVSMGVSMEVFHDGFRDD